MGGWNKNWGEENLTNDTPLKKGVWTPPRTVRFPTPSGFIALFSLFKNPRQSRTEALLEGPEFSGGRVLWYVFLPPYVLHPPHIMAQIRANHK